MLIHLFKYGKISIPYTERAVQMDIYDYLDLLQKDIQTSPIQEIEQRYFDICTKLCGTDIAKAIQLVSLKDYQEALQDLLAHGLTVAYSEGAKAIYFEYDLDNDWDSTLFICEDYQPLEEDDDEWACEWVDEINGPSLATFGNLYESHGFDDTNEAIGSTLYLIVRTVLEYMRAYNEVNAFPKVNVCIGFHDQDPVMRINEAASVL